MAWIVETLIATVDAELEALPADQIAKFIHIGELIQVLGARAGPGAACKASSRAALGNPNEGQGWHLPSSLCGGQDQTACRDSGFCEKEPEDPAPGN